MPMDDLSPIASNAHGQEMENNMHDCSHDCKPKMTANRRSSKPLMEKRRRARINDSLGQLKSLILEATNKDGSRHSKLEKADILEMTVRYLRNIQRHQLTGSPNSSVDLNRYRLGYTECINEVSRYLKSSESGTQLHTQLIGHLANRCSPPSSPVPQHQQQVAFVPAPSPAPIVSAATMPPSPNHSIHVQVGQPPLPHGEIRVVLPPEALPNGQLPSHFIPVYAHPTPSPSSSASSVETTTSPLPSKQELSYGVAQTTISSNSPLTACTAPSVVACSPVSVQLPTKVPTTAAEIRLSSPMTQNLTHQPIQQTLPQPQFYHQDVGNNMLLNCIPAYVEENVWRPW